MGKRQNITQQNSDDFFEMVGQIRAKLCGFQQRSSEPLNGQFEKLFEQAHASKLLVPEHMRRRAEIEFADLLEELEELRVRCPIDD